ncbi:MAG: hypothetical protein WC365_04280 [Candidatus Babeliales bacterium]
MKTLTNTGSKPKEIPNFILVEYLDEETGIICVDRIINPEWIKHRNSLRKRLKRLYEYLFKGYRQFDVPL